MKVILGTMTFGHEGVGARIFDADKVQQILDLFKSYGHDELDTARMYCSGNTEKMLAQLHVLDSFKLATKAYPHALGDHSPEKLRAQFRASLDALKTEKVDIFYLHAPDAATPFVETLEEVNRLYKEGHFTELGLSNFAAWQVMDVWWICKQHNWILPTVYQGMYNGITRDVERELLPCLRHLNIRFYAYNPLAGGLLTDKILASPEVPVESGSRFDPATAQGQRYRTRYLNQIYLDEIELIRQACREYGITTAEAALRWMVHHSKLDAAKGDAVIIGASSYDQAKTNLDSLAKVEKLPDTILEMMDKAWLVIRGVCPPYYR